MSDQLSRGGGKDPAWLLLVRLEMGGRGMGGLGGGRPLCWPVGERTPCWPGGGRGGGGRVAEEEEVEAEVAGVERSAGLVAW